MLNSLQQTSAYRWWETLQSREKLLLKVMLGFLIVALFYLLIWSPIIEAKKQAERKMDNAQSTWNWLSKQNAKLSAVSGQIKQVSIDSQAELTRYLQKQLSIQNIKSAVSSISPLTTRGNEAIEIRFTEVKAPRFFRWLSKMEQEGVVASDLTVNQVKQGVVEVKVIFEVIK